MESFELNIKFDKADAEVNITVEYPEGNAIAAINAIRQAGTNEYIAGLMQALAHDPSVQKRLEEAGIAFSDDDEDDWEDD